MQQTHTHKAVTRRVKAFVKEKDGSNVKKKN